MTNKNTRNISKVSSILAGLALVSSQQAQAEKVDTELILLIDVSGNKGNSVFAEQQDAYVEAFRSSEVMDAIYNGSMKSVAASVVLFAGKSQQYTAVEWMKIHDVDSANAFANAMQSVEAPFTGKNAMGEAIGYASKQFGEETGGEANGFESLYQIIQVSSHSVDNDSGHRRRDRGNNVAEQRDAAIAAGVDRIDGVASDRCDHNLEEYFQDYVIGGKDAEVSYYELGDKISPLLSRKLVKEIESVNSVPEPSSAILVGLGSLGFLFRRNR